MTAEDRVKFAAVDATDLEDLQLLWSVIMSADLQVTEDGEDVRVTFHARGDGYTPFGTFVTHDQAKRLRRLLGYIPDPRPRDLPPYWEGYADGYLERVDDERRKP